jgi:hypothetical protein
MTQMLDCLVSYFGLDEDEQPSFRRYFCYHILASAGPTAGTGVASVTTLAVHDNTERCISCQNFHTVEAGGPVAAITAAVRHLDAYHHQDHLRKVESAIRGLDGNQSRGAGPCRGEFSVRERQSHVQREVFGGPDIPTRKG